MARMFASIYARPQYLRRALAAVEAHHPSLSGGAATAMPVIISQDGANKETLEVISDFKVSCDTIPKAWMACTAVAALEMVFPSIEAFCRGVNRILWVGLEVYMDIEGCCTSLAASERLLLWKPNPS